MAALVLVIPLNPFSGHLQTVDEVVAYSIANHSDTSMEMAFRAGDIRDVGQWFSQRLGIRSGEIADLMYHFVLSFLSNSFAGRS
jgi:hypothetical protein